MSIKRGTSAQEDKRTNQLQANVTEWFSISARVVWQVYSTKSKETTRSMFSLHAKCKNVILPCWAMNVFCICSWAPYICLGLTTLLVQIIVHVKHSEMSYLSLAVKGLDTGGRVIWSLTASELIRHRIHMRLKYVYMYEVWLRFRCEWRLIENSSTSSWDSIYQVKHPNS